MKFTSGISIFSRQMFIRQYIPALFSALVFAVADMADALVVGNRMGAVGLAAIAFSLPIYMFYNVIMHSFGLGGAIHFSNKMASGDEEGARRSFQGVFITLMIISVFIAIFGNLGIKGLMFILGAPKSNPVLYSATKTYLGIILAAAPLFFFDYSIGYYLRNDDFERESSIASGIGNVLDLSLNIILVLFLDMGVKGAALATLFGLVVGSSIQFAFLFRKTSHLKLFPFNPEFCNLLSIYKIGISSFVSYIYSFVFILIGNNAMIRLAGDSGVAVFDVVINLGNMAYYLFNAVSTSTQPIISTYEGECNYDECDKIENVSTRVNSLTSFILMFLFVVFAPLICNLFGLYDPATVEYGSLSIRIYSLCLLFVGLNLAMSNYYAARNISTEPFMIATLRGIAILVPAALICIRLGKNAFWFAYIFTELFTYIIIRIHRKRHPVISKRMDKERVLCIMLGSDINRLGPAIEDIEMFCEKWGANPKQLYYIQMTVEEVCSAIITNGFKSPLVNRTNFGYNVIELTLVAAENNDLFLHIRDNAIFFNPFDMNKKALKDIENKDSDFNALGMDVIKQKAKSFYYRRFQGFNTMVVKI